MLWNVEEFLKYFELDFFSIRFYAAEEYLFLLNQQSKRNVQKRTLGE